MKRAAMHLWHVLHGAMWTRGELTIVLLVLSVALAGTLAAYRSLLVASASSKPGGES